ncbi:Variant Ionotropic Glutamate Receptor [Penaeus vannamei]|uniref:Variant Ionotropic Glutamate Receptor n=1 Tax=Penaeus vannamei TaxID=6689 RepID=A0A423U6C3_PENVA|nr:Variant Ionotropic Glutamate Receptor [Penaeus vannamei]
MPGQGPPPTPLLESTTFVAVLCPRSPRLTPSARVPRRHVAALRGRRKVPPAGRVGPRRFATWDDLFRDRFADFGGRAIHLASDYDDMPLIFETDDGLDGTNIRMMDALAAQLNFTYTSTEQAPDGRRRVGREGRERDVEWDLGELHRGAKDLAINYFTVTPERAEDFDYSVPYYNEGFGLILKVPPPLPRWRSVLYPFTGAVWAAVGCSFAVAVASFHFLARRRTRASFAVNATTIFQGLTTQSLNRVPDSWFVRGFLGLWWFMCWILDISYTCNLIAVLTVPVYPTRIETVDSLAFSDLRLCMLDYGEFVPGALATSSDPALAALGAKTDLVPIIEELDYYGEEGCVELVLAGTHAHTETYSYAKLIYSDLGHGASVYAMRPQLYEGNLVFFFRKKTPWKDKFNDGITRLGSPVSCRSGTRRSWRKETASRWVRGIRRTARRVSR